MAEKEISNIIKLQIEAGKATPAPPVGPALGSSGVNKIKESISNLTLNNTTNETTENAESDQTEASNEETTNTENTVENEASSSENTVEE